ncbi:hypothetical protein GNZ24_31630 [Burkholderia thailandensis]|uniref:hypothetical protein n=1 Tax=Burkholderia thailandensis TaxID=57975 RepID=UPI0012E8AE9C|nr:hypothetical protein [Burkholderia thailandensis]MUV29162.1 hypothetical protein [Burkholderia thailandensis]MUV31469.1 hypothetical protein [Burkholderia thailandensis]
MDMSEFRITYDGPALETSEMDVRELAPALIAIGDLLEAATKSLCGDQVKSQVNVRGSFKTGSFGIDFNLVTSFVSRMRELFAGNEATAIANALAILGAIGFAAEKGGRGLFSVLKWLRGRPIERVQVQDNSAILYVEGDMLEIELSVLTLLRDVSVREATTRVLSPLSREGITIFSAGSDSDIVETVTDDEIGWFHTPEQQDILLVDETRKMAFSIVSLAFKDDNKWRLYDGAATIHASITDADFLKRVDSNQISFAKGDVLVCSVRVKQWQTPSGAKTDYEVTEVLEHRTAARQIQLPGL